MISLDFLVDFEDIRQSAAVARAHTVPPMIPYSSGLRESTVGTESVTGGAPPAVMTSFGCCALHTLSDNREWML